MFKHIQLTWTDLSNITRCIFVTPEAFERHVRVNGTSLSQCCLALPYTGDVPVVNDPLRMTFVPDIDPPLRSLESWLPECQVYFGNWTDHNGDPWVIDPRTFLARQEALLQEVNVQVTFGFELEFYLLNEDGSPVDSTLLAETKSFQEGKSWRIVSEVVETLTRDFDLPVWRYHSESGPGQFEISIGPFPQPMANGLVGVADSLVLARQAISNIAAKHGKKATFVPKPLEALASGMHVHISLERYSKNLFEQNKADGEAFLAGILKNLPNLMLIFAPTGNSYERLQPSTWSGAFQCYGTENKEAAIRLVRNGAAEICRFEVKPVDGTANPYLILGALVGAGVKGLRERTPLPRETTVDPGTLPADQQPPRLPKTLSEAITAFEESEFNQALFGQELHQLIVKLRTVERDHWESSTVSKESKLKTLLQRY